jgi:hypothetical protein
VTAHNPFQVDDQRALDALVLTWGDEYDEFWCHDGEWHAHLKGGRDEHVIAGETPDELNVNLRADWLARQGSPPAAG